MNKYIGFFLLFQILSNCTIGQNDLMDSSVLTKITPDSVIFQMHLDSVTRYHMVNNFKEQAHILAAKEMFQEGIIISDALKFDYYLKRVRHVLIDFKYVDAFKILDQSRYLTDRKTVYAYQISDYNYLEGFILMNLGDMEFAQQSFYKLLDDGKESNDTIKIINALYSLGQLMAYDQKYPEAEKYLLRVADLELKTPNNESQIVSTYFELTNIYQQMKEYDKANHYIELGIEAAEKINLTVLRFDYFIKKGNIYLETENLVAAKEVLTATKGMAAKLQTESIVNGVLKFEANYLKKTSQNKKALAIYKMLLAKNQDLQPEHRMDLHEKSFEICEIMGLYRKGMNHLLMIRELKDKMIADKKRQQTSYLQIKYNSEQKNKENQILSAKVKEEQTRSKLLYFAIFFSTLGVFCFYWMATQRKKYSHQLELEVAKRTKELQKANKLLTRSYEELGQFNKILSHDLKEPLRSIVGFSTLAQRKLPEDSSIIEYLHIIEKSGNQLHRLIEDVSAFQRISHISKKEMKVVDTSEILQSIVESINELITDKKAIIAYDRLPVVKSNQSFLYLVCKNLIENGLKYNESETPLINITYERKNKQHFFYFSDNGIGIRPEFHDKIFGMFKRLHNRGTYSGTGLGLSISRKMMMKINGTLRLRHSAEGAGSIFEVSFPVVEFIGKKDDRSVKNRKAH